MKVMRLGFICHLEESDFRFAAEHGFPVLEWNVNGLSEKLLSREAEVAAWLERYKLSFSAIGNFGRDRMSEDGEVRAVELQSDKAIIDFCARNGIRTFVCAPGPANPKLSFVRNCQNAVEVMGERLAYARSKGVQVALYNCHWGNCTFTPEAWAIVLTALPELGIKYDPSHTFYDGRDYLAEARDWGHRFLHFHAKDVLSIGGQRFEDPPAGMGQVEWGPLMHILHHHNYRGDIILEPHSRTWSGPRYYAGILQGKRALEHMVF